MALENLPLTGQLDALSRIQGKLIDLGFEFGPRLLGATG